MVVKYFNNYESMSNEAADFVVGIVNQNKKAVLGLPTGSTPLGLYKNLIAAGQLGKADFSGVTTFNLDEYYPIKRDNDNSYYKFMYDNLFNHVNIKKENINILNGECENVHEECRAYEEKIEQCGGIDVMILGIGANGHIGFNEPDNFLNIATHMAKLTNDTREKNERFFDSIEEVPTHALTMGMGTIFNSGKILMLVSGMSKKFALKEMLENKITTQNPSTFLNLHRDVTVLVTEN